MFQNIVYYFVRNYIYILSNYVPSLFNIKEKLSDFGLQFISFVMCDCKYVSRYKTNLMVLDLFEKRHKNVML